MTIKVCAEGFLKGVANISRSKFRLKLAAMSFPVMLFLMTFYATASGQTLPADSAAVVTNSTVQAMVRGGAPVLTIIRAIKTATKIDLYINDREYAQIIAAGASKGDADQIMRAIHDREYNGVDRYFGSSVSSTAQRQDVNPTISTPVLISAPVAPARVPVPSLAPVDAPASALLPAPSTAPAPPATGPILTPSATPVPSSPTTVIWQNGKLGCDQEYSAGRLYRSCAGANGRISATMTKNRDGVYAFVKLENIGANPSTRLNLLPQNVSLEENATNRVFQPRDMEKEARSARKWDLIAGVIAVAGGEVANARGTTTTGTVTTNGYTSTVTIHQQGNPEALAESDAQVRSIRDGQAAREMAASSYLKAETVHSGEYKAGWVAFPRSKALDYTLHVTVGRTQIVIPFHFNKP